MADNELPCYSRASGLQVIFGKDYPNRIQRLLAWISACAKMTLVFFHRKRFIPEILDVVRIA